MKDSIPAPAFGKPPASYDVTYFANMIRSLELHLAQLRDVGPVRISTLNISNLPTDDTDLRSGDIWNDSGTLKVVP